MNQEAYDLVVIGGGPAGTGGALAAAAFGKRVALVERESHVGGAGLNTGTIPSKALRESALLISGWRARKLLGVDLSLRRECTVADLTRHEVDVRDAMRGQTETRMIEVDKGVVKKSCQFGANRSLANAAHSRQKYSHLSEYLVFIGHEECSRSKQRF